MKRGAGDAPWSACRRPWSLMYFTAHGRALPCCIAPFSARGYETYTLGDATQQTLREIWNGSAYQDFREALVSETPPKPCQQLRAAMEPLDEPIRWGSPNARIACCRKPRPRHSAPARTGGRDSRRTARSRSVWKTT